MSVRGGGWHVMLEGITLSGGRSDFSSESELGFDQGGFGDTPFGGYGISNCGFGLGPFGITENGFGIGGCENILGDVVGYLTEVPDGMGLPDLRTEDVTYPQRDGVRHFSDWYGARIITLDNVWLPSHSCNDCPDVRARLRALIKAWSRKCEDVELVLYTDCHGQGDRDLVGPFGVTGRPRVATYTWIGQGTRHVQLTLRFDAVDHRLLVLDADGNPGSGGESAQISPSQAIDVSVGGSLCVHPTITLNGQLVGPVVLTNMSTGESLTYSGNVGNTTPVIIDTDKGTAMEGTTRRTALLSGTTRWTLNDGANTIQMTAAAGTGNAVLSWRPAVENA